MDGQRCTFNDLLSTGPKLQTDILNRFRENEVGITADVKMMFRMIKIEPEDRKYQHIYYRENPESELQEYEINVLLFGEKSSPYLAQRVIKQLIEDEKHTCQAETAKALEENLYIDDFVNSVPTIELAIQRRKEVTELMKKGHFIMKKWTSSHPKVLEDLSTDDLAKIEFTEEDKSMKILGLLWEAQTDLFSFRSKPFEGNVTKRTCLSYIARTFDCLGLVCPVVFWMKQFLQQLWSEKLSDPFSKKLTDKWNNFVNNMCHIEEVKIPKCVIKNGATSFYLAGFSDGSSLGYAACVYLVVDYEEGNRKCHLIKAKSKLSPLKTISIPRLELCGFLLLSQLCSNLVNTLSITAKSVHLFTDSEIVLGWVRKPPHLLKTYVANRVTKILDLTSNAIYSHVKSEENPADCATRGLAPNEIAKHPLWWAGPQFLMNENSTWTRVKDLPDNVLPEMKSARQALVINEPEENYLYHKLIVTKSSLEKVQKTMAWLVRFVYNCKNPQSKRDGQLTVAEINEAMDKCLLIAQQNDFQEEIKNIKNKKKRIPQSLLKLSPFIDEKQKWVKGTGATAMKGSLVYLKTENCAPLAWPLGRIINTYPGEDGITRAVDVRIKDKLYRRPVNKLLVLPY